MMNRREMFQVTAASTAALLVPTALPADDKPAAAFTLGKLPYAYDALEPSIDAETMTIHHTKHHQTYVDNLNKAVGGTPLAGQPLDQILAKLKTAPEDVRNAIRNNGGGHWNHTFFWNIMAKPGTGGEPTGDLLKAIDASFGSVDGFKKAFLAAALGQFGSGWAWLIPGTDKPLAIVATPNQDNPQMTGRPAPILGVDVWEHAYYLKYRNLRAKYVEAWFNVINWKAVAELFAAKK